MRETNPSKTTHADGVLFEPAGPDEGARVLACLRARLIASLASLQTATARPWGLHWGPGGPLREMQAI